METEKQTLEIFRRLNLNYQRQALVVLSTLLFCQDSQKLSSIPERSVALSETSPVESSAAVESVAEPLPETETVAPESPVALPETEPAVEPSPVAPSSPTYRLVLNVPEIGLKGFAD
ncbi:MAG: hypothetical protein IJY15_11700 [Thermoguttaceae bacterium]|nr:hypothetical protein [Thermoguttaceae bacterium]MBQ9128406.1 hypothetical protein [Thermoguttaceae bacterium]